MYYNFCITIFALPLEFAKALETSGALEEFYQRHHGLTATEMGMLSVPGSCDQPGDLKRASPTSKTALVEQLHS